MPAFLLEDLEQHRGILRKWVVEKFSVEYDLWLVFSFIGVR